MNSITRRLIKKTFSSQTATTAVNGPLKLFCIIKALAAKLVFDYDLSLHLHFRHKQKNPMNTLAPFMHVRTATLEYLITVHNELFHLHVEHSN